MGRYHGGAERSASNRPNEESQRIPESGKGKHRSGNERTDLKQLKKDFYKAIVALSEKLHTPVNDVWMMNADDLLTYISIFTEESQQSQPMSEEDSILFGNKNNIVSTKDLQQLNKEF